MRVSIATIATVTLLLSGCATEPTLLEIDAPPMRIADIPSNKIGHYALDRMPTRSWVALRNRKPFERARIGRRLLTLKFAEGCVVKNLFYVTDKPFTQSTLGDVELDYAVVELGAHEGGTEGLLATLTAAGLQPTRVVGIDREGLLTLATATDGWFLRWINGKPSSVVRAGAGKDPFEILELRDLDDLRRQAKDPKKRNAVLPMLTQASQKTAANDEQWQRGIQAICDDVYAEMLAPHRVAMQQLDAEMAKARGVEARMRVMAKMYLVAIKLRDGNGSLIPPAEEWRLANAKLVFDAHGRLVGDGKWRFIARSHSGALARAMSAKSWAGKMYDERRKFLTLFQMLAYDERYFGIRHGDPFMQAGLRLRQLGKQGPPVAAPEKYYLRDERGAMKRLAEAGELDPFSQAAAEQFQRSIPKQNVHSTSRFPEQLIHVAQLRALLAKPSSSITAECAQLVRHASATKKLAKPARAALGKELAKRLAKLESKSKNATDQAVARALRRVLAAEDPEHLELTMAGAGEMRKRAHAVPGGDDIEARAAALARLSSLAGTFGPASEYLAGALSAPAGRALADQAAAALAKGHRAHAAWLYLRAATLGDRTAPAPISSWQARRNFTALQDAEKKNALADRDERADWLTKARIHAYLATVLALPRVAATEPVYDLQSRFVASQLAGRSRLSTAFGLRLSGLADVRRGRKDSEDVKLVQNGDGIAWRLATAGGTPVDLAKYRIDHKGWSELRKLRRELDEAEANLEAARKSRSSSRVTLQNRDAELTQQAKALKERVDRREVDPSTARVQIARMQRESSALKFAIQNYNRRQQHIGEMVRSFNQKVKPHNALLERLLAELSTAYEQLLRPATDAWSEHGIAAAKVAETEKRARRWLLGLQTAPELDAALPVPHPNALARSVRDVSDPAIAARDLLGTLARRTRDQRLWRGVSLEDHIDALRGSFVAYGQQYGTDDLVSRIFRGNSRITNALQKRIAGFFDKKRRDAILKLLQQ